MKKKAHKENNDQPGSYISKALAILTPIALVVAFLIERNAEVLNIFSPTTVNISSDSAHSNQNFTISLKKENKEYNIPSKEINNILEIEHGNYVLSILFFQEKFLEQNIYIKKNKNNIILIPNIFKNRILVNVHNHTPNPFRGQPLSLEVTSSGNGCLWIYEIINDNYNKLYPEDSNCIEIIAGYAVDGIGLIAGEDKKTETLAFLVTSEKTQDAANKIIHNQFSRDPVKAELKPNKLNWGLTTITYDIKVFKQ